MKDHEIRDLVNQVRDIARDYGQTQQLRERLAGVLVPVLKGARDPLTTRQQASLYVALGHFRSCGSERCAAGILSILKEGRE